jgi:hypothetical protein
MTFTTSTIHEKTPARHRPQTERTLRLKTYLLEKSYIGSKGGNREAKGNKEEFLYS